MFLYLFRSRYFEGHSRIGKVITLYEGKEANRNGYWGQVNKDTKEQIIYESPVYQAWFQNMLAEIQR